MRTKFFLNFSLIFISGVFGVLKAQELAPSHHSNLVRTHAKVPKPSSVSSKDDLLFVGLEPYLGNFSNDRNLANYMKLISAGKNLILKDSKGIIHKSSEIHIGWKKIPLKVSQRQIRQIAGPFASFESAKQFALKLEKIGIASKIAHPKDWEVWVSGHIQIPAEMGFVLVDKTINFEVRPVLILGNQEFLLTGPISIDAFDGLKWKQGIYEGPFLLQSNAYGSWTLIEKVSLENYLNGVVPHEIGAGAPTNALAAQAILARTWALANLKRFEIDGYHLCSDVQCQVYKDPQIVTPQVKQAIALTTGKFLAWKGKPINAFYHATNGGVTASAHEAWSISSRPYLSTKLDGSFTWRKKFELPLNSDSSIKSFLSEREGSYGNDHYRFRWKRIFTSEKLKKALHSVRPDFESPTRIEVLQRGPSGRVLELAIFGVDNQAQIILRLDSIRRNLRDLPSTLFLVEQLEEGVWEFSGGGFGHGVGLSQAGAIDLALKGWSLDQILNHYYPGTEYGILP